MNEDELDEVLSPGGTLFEACLMLRDVVARRKEVEERIQVACAPTLERIAALQAELDKVKDEFDAELGMAEEDETALRECVVDLYYELQDDRTARLMSGEEVPQFELPQGVSFGVTPTVRFLGPVPIEYMLPDEKRVKAQLKDGQEFDFARLVPKYHVRVGG